MTAQASTPPVPAYGSATPTAEIEITADLVRSLLVAQHPDLADLPISFAASGWDNAMFRLGQDLAVRLPRREAALSFSVSEQRWLPTLSLPLKTPTPLRLGQPGSGFPWPWSVVPWIEGETADLDQPDADQGQALAGFFRALHVPAPNEAPLNPYRGVPLNVRVPLLEPRLEFLAGKTGLVTPAHLAMWQRALAAPMDAQPTWLHGDLALRHDAWLFSVYQHWQYVPEIVCAAYLTALSRLWLDPGRMAQRGLVRSWQSVGGDGRHAARLPRTMRTSLDMDQALVQCFRLS